MFSLFLCNFLYQLCRIDLIQTSFKCFKLIVTDYLSTLPSDCYLACVETAASFGHQKQDLNIALSAIGSLVSVILLKYFLISLFETIWINFSFYVILRWYGRGWGESVPPLGTLSHGHTYTSTDSEVLLTAFSWHHCCLRNCENKRQMSGVLTWLMDITDPSKGLGKPWFETNGTDELQGPKSTYGSWTYCWSLPLVTFIPCFVF